MARIAVAVSGGADSLFALVSLHAQGHEVLALHGRFLPEANAARSAPDTTAKTASDAVPGLQDVCATLGIDLHVLDLRVPFDSTVVAPFVRAYAQGRTPNPCALCNAGIKFGLLLDAALERGAECLATGHYAALRPQPAYAPTGEALLAKGEDHSKDQSYFLALVPRQRLARALFPLAATHKKDNVAALKAQGIAVPLPRESQEICFVPADAYRLFLEAEAGARGIALPGPGPMLLRQHGKDTALGEHRGLWHYTEGQRRGLNVAWKEPLYVAGKDAARNALLLAPKEDVSIRGCVAGQINMIVPRERWPHTILVRVRYRQQEVAARVECRQSENGHLHIVFEQEQPPTAPGQIAALYDAAGVVLAGGIIEKTFQGPLKHF